MHHIWWKEASFQMKCSIVHDIRALNLLSTESLYLFACIFALHKFRQENFFPTQLTTPTHDDVFSFCFSPTFSHYFHDIDVLQETCAGEHAQLSLI